MRRRRRHLSYPTRVALFLLAMTIVFGEYTILTSLRSHLPSGIGPCLQYSEPPAEILGDDGHAWARFTPEELDAVGEAVENDIRRVDALPPAELARHLRDWTRSQAELIGMEISSRNPVEILNGMRDGRKAHCEPLATVYMAALSSRGLVCREVDLFAEPGQFKGAHTTVEVLLGADWVIQDPTFNAIPYGPDNYPLGAAGVQKAYSSGAEVVWQQDLTPTEPTMDSYSVAPEDLFGYAFFRLRRFPSDVSKTSLRATRLRDRLIGHPEAILLTRKPFPLSESLTSGMIDRYLLLAVLLLLLPLLTGRPTSESAEDLRR